MNADLTHDEPRQLRVRLKLDGQVQGVGFRWYVMRRSTRWPEIRGFVRNLADGSVEVVAEGSKADLVAFAAVAASGPPDSRVVNVQQQWSDSEGGFHLFEIRV